MSTIASTAEAARRELGGSFNGELIGPDDASYNEGRAVFNAMIDRRPALIVRPSNAAAVSAAVEFGRSHDLPIAVRGGGHNGGGLGVVDDGIVIDLAAIKDVKVDPGARTVRVGGGATWGMVDAATNQHGMATPSGICSSASAVRPAPIFAASSFSSPGNLPNRNTRNCSCTIAGMNDHSSALICSSLWTGDCESSQTIWPRASATVRGTPGGGAPGAVVPAGVFMARSFAHPARP